jgi:hypothetical protein
MAINHLVAVTITTALAMSQFILQAANGRENMESPEKVQKRENKTLLAPRKQS